jgi:hypothetical protein
MLGRLELGQPLTQGTLFHHERGEDDDRAFGVGVHSMLLRSGDGVAMTSPHQCSTRSVRCAPPGDAVLSVSAHPGGPHDVLSVERAPTL